MSTGVMTFVNGDRNQEVREQFSVTAKSETELGIASEERVWLSMFIRTQQTLW